ncbi:MAG: hypothetical protein TU35_003915 [Thermoproteus sp. AZ2]|uniref:Uncharacterized protein n=1 Tax=Thermoproteus sp. AZ2 TaxID=1609232 RepID=A0ACC6V0D2_9CREN
MDESLSTVMLVIAMFIVGLAIGLMPALFLKQAKPQPQAQIVIQGNGSAVTITASPSCPVYLNGSGAYTCTGKLNVAVSVNGSVSIG